MVSCVGIIGTIVNETNHEGREGIFWEIDIESLCLVLVLVPPCDVESPQIIVMRSSWWLSFLLLICVSRCPLARAVSHPRS